MENNDSREQWLLYEQEKAKISKENLTCQEYEMRIKELVDKLGL